jgi:cytochrome c-type biogenesis protein
MIFAASESSLWQGVGLLVVYSLGLAMPFLATSVSINRFLSFYGRFRRHLHKLELATGGLLMVVGVLILTRHFTLINSWMNQIPFFRIMAEKFL